MSFTKHAGRVLLLLGFATAQLAWLSAHSEVLFADGLRYIQQAERLDKGAWIDGLFRSIDHPMHPMAIMTVHRLIGGEGPVAWQRAAQGAALLTCALMIIPLYLVALEVYGANTAWLGCLLVFANPLIGYIVVNVLSETTFLLF